MGLTHTPESKVMVVGICWELLCSILGVSIYYTPELDIRVKFYDHLNFSRASMVHFRASRYIMGLSHTPESKVIAVWICWEIRVEFHASRYIMCQIRRFEWNVTTIWISREPPLFFFEHLEISWARHIHPRKNLWLFEFAESFRAKFQEYPYMMRLNQRSEWNVMTFEFLESLSYSFSSISIYHGPHTHTRVKSYGCLNFLRATVNNFESLDILWAGIGHPSENLRPFEFLENLCCSFASVLIYHGPHTYTRVKSYGRLNLPRAFVLSFKRLDVLCARIEDLSKMLWPFKFLESFLCSFSSVSIYHGPHTYTRVKSYGCWNLSKASMFNFERLDISGASHTQTSQKLWMFEFCQSFRVQFRESRYIMSRNWTSKWKFTTIWISREPPMFIFGRLHLSWALHIHPSQRL